MGELQVFDDDSYNKVLYGRFKEIYIPMINKEIILSSLEFYNPNYIKGNILKNIIIVSVELFNSYFFVRDKREFAICKSIEKELLKVKGYKYCAICKREDNINKDYIFKLMDESGNVLGYGKYPGSDDKKDFVIKEVKNLRYVNSLDLKSAKVPKLLVFNEDKNIYIQSTISKLKHDSGKLSMLHVNFLSELYSKTKKEYKFKESEIYNRLVSISDYTDDEEIINLSKKVLDKINLENIKYCYCHGDFYPPNIKSHKNSLFVYDWENGRDNIIYFDIFHYVANIDLVSNIESKKKIIKNILYNNKLIDKFEDDNKIDKNLRITMLILYVYDVIYEFFINMNVDKRIDGVLKNYIIALNTTLQIT